MLEADPTRSVAEITDSLGISHGRLDREFVRLMGLSPRALARLLRVRRPLERLDVRRPIDWAALAAEQGWMQGVDALRAEGPLSLGARLIFHTRGQDRPAEVVALEPGVSLTLRSAQGPVTADYRYCLTPEGGGTRLRLVTQCEVRGWLSVFAPRLRWLIRRTDGGQVQALKRLVEA